MLVVIKKKPIPCPNGADHTTFCGPGSGVARCLGASCRLPAQPRRWGEVPGPARLCPPAAAGDTQRDAGAGESSTVPGRGPERPITSIGSCSPRAAGKVGLGNCAGAGGVGVGGRDGAQLGIKGWRQQGCREPWLQEGAGGFWMRR